VQTSLDGGTTWVDATLVLAARRIVLADWSGQDVCGAGAGHRRQHGREQLTLSAAIMVT